MHILRTVPLFALALTVSACVTTSGAPSPGGHPRQNAARPALTAECTGPNAQNFNGARLTQDIVNSIPQQFAEDREILRRVLAGKGDKADQDFARLCHGLILTS